MNYKMVSRFISQILGIEAVFMLPALLISANGGEMEAAKAFLISISVLIVIMTVLNFASEGAEKRGFYTKEGMACVGLGWCVMSLLGCLPFYLSGEIPSYVDALFEMVSGFTTTGASILPEVEGLSRGILYWRSFSHWVGGMGVLVFLLAITSGSGGYTMHLLRAESPGPNVGKLVPKMRQTAMILYAIYIGLTVLDFLLLLAGGMPLFDAVCTAFGTAGTGGFGIKNDSIAGYSPYLQNVCTVFMILFGVNFSCYYMLLLKQFKAVWKDQELRMYVGLILVSILVICLDTRGLFSTVEETIRHSAFQVGSIITTTGFATTDFDQWPTLSKTILLCLMLIGASAGSTGGGFKCGRFLFLFKDVCRKIRQTLNPRKVEVVRYNGQVLDEKMLQNIYVYLAIYVMITVGAFLIISVDGKSMMTNLSAVIACFNNIGPGLEAVGPTCNYAGYSVLSKLVLTITMLAGRLEIFPIVILFSGRTWKRG